MNTSIRFPSRTEDVRNEVIGLVETMLGGQALESEIQDATSAVVFAFYIADARAGNGVGYDGTSTVREFYATANIVSGEFNLYREITL